MRTALADPCMPGIDFFVVIISQIEERVNKFDKFIKETEAKRRRALEKYQNERRLREQKTRELEIYTQELKKLRKRLLN